MSDPGTVAAAATGAVAAVGTQTAAAYLVPTAMVYFGTVVPGVGTIFASGGMVATMQTFAMASSGPVAIVGGATAVVAKLGYNWWTGG